jgi:hypothetical protein
MCACTLWNAFNPFNPALAAPPAPPEPSEPVAEAYVVSGFSRTAPAPTPTPAAEPLTVQPLAMETIVLDDLEIPTLPEMPTLVVETIDLAPLEMQ